MDFIAYCPSATPSGRGYTALDAQRRRVQPQHPTMPRHGSRLASRQQTTTDDHTHDAPEPKDSLQRYPRAAW